VSERNYIPTYAQGYGRGEERKPGKAFANLTDEARDTIFFSTSSPHDLSSLVVDVSQNIVLLDQ
jgi:hypothetical protein